MLKFSHFLLQQPVVTSFFLLFTEGLSYIRNYSEFDPVSPLSSLDGIECMGRTGAGRERVGRTQPEWQARLVKAPKNVSKKTNQAKDSPTVLYILIEIIHSQKYSPGTFKHPTL